MKCEACDKRQATVHLTEIVNKKKREMHLCEECARDKGVSVKAAFIEFSSKTSVKDGAPAAAGAIEKAPPGAVQRVEELAGVACPVCGITFAEFRASGRLGCSNDYMTFKRGLVPLLEKIHGTVEHKGKVPANVGRRLERQRRIADLRTRQKEAIEREDYETAGKLRDEIYTLEEEAVAKGKG